MDREFFAPDAIDVAPQLLGAVIGLSSPEGTVCLRITEVEAYMGLGSSGRYDPGSHSKDRKTERNASMFLGPGHAYVYLSYGTHFALNIVCSPTGVASGVLIRSGEILEGQEIAEKRRLAMRPHSTSPTPLGYRDLARGPGNLATALGITRLKHNGMDILAPPFILEASGHISETISSGPRVGVAGAAGGPEFPWRFWLSGNSSVSAFRPGRNAPRA
ncbi:DNA-3-methyladenine glycosylase [Glutamicibacter soli]|uniref:Putative 3-methyladenine DNA glycosylase n=1 Tax=Glutamicibacter soli TaxID=453836 RepID=A0A6L9GAI2_9MICC|nr:DNA-3-methyladenine glycosylase [Glutamicibacter soli]NAZ17470.1 DNA-3-methyladenine glycosylase [Glutamicibacter soli]